ncbi:phage tail protein [Pseudomonas syringae]|nr:phage tail protein [Pseudomonas syringae]
MINLNSQFFATLTNVGAAKQANADALGLPWKITHMAIGDANGADPIPSVAQTKLINEVRRAPLNTLKIDPANASVIIAEQVIPADVGGWWIREIGLYDADGDFVAVANCAPSFKPLLVQGSGRTQIVRLNIIVTNAGNVELKIDPAVVLATRAYVDASILEVLPKNKTAGQFTRVKVNERGIVQSGDNPDTLAGYGIKNAYTKLEVEAMLAQASALAVGVMIAMPMNKLPPGFLEVDGGVYSATAYPDLAAFFEGRFNLGNEGAGMFRMPESRAQFLRGWDHGRGVDAGRTLGSDQLDETKAHSHHVLFGSGAVGTGNTLGVINSGSTQRGGTGAQYAGTAGDAPYISSTGGVETRPRNLAVMWCIKAWNAPINQGNIDIAALAALAQQASEIKLGMAKIATQAQTDTGTDDATIITPKKLRWGFSILKAQNGYIAFPSWLGGLVIQWGSTTATAADYLVTFPIAFPTAPAVLVFGQNEGTVSFHNNYLVTTGFKYRNAAAGYPDAFTWICIGY